MNVKIIDKNVVNPDKFVVANPPTGRQLKRRAVREIHGAPGAVVRASTRSG